MEKKNKRYTEEEDRFIRDNYLNMSDEEIGNVLGRTKNSIKIHRNRKLGIHRNRFIPAGLNKHTYSYVKKFIEIESGSGCKLISQKYNGRNEQILITCNQCARVFQTTFANFKAASKFTCNQCSRLRVSKKQRHTIEYVKEYVSQHGYTLLSDNYANAKSKIHFCDNDGYKFCISFGNFSDRVKNGGGFRRFGNNNIYTIDNIKLFLKINNINVELVSMEYENEKKLIWKCSMNHIFSSLLHNVLCGHGCPHCAGQGAPDYCFIEKEFKLRGYNILPFEYVNNTTKIPYICNDHVDRGVQWIDWAHFTIGCGCYYCGKERMIQSLTKTTEQFKDDVKRVAGNEFIVLGEYVKGDVPIEMFHVVCGNSFMIKPGNFLNGNRCNVCNLSKDACKIWMYLKNNNYCFEIEYRVDGCVNIDTGIGLPFDFVVFDNKEDKNILCLIEYDGKQHFEPVNFNGISDDNALVSHVNTVRRDKIKNDFCKNNGINLLRIPYWTNNIEGVVCDFLLGLKYNTCTL